MKLLESAKDLKTSCYIYFLIQKKVRHNNPSTQRWSYIQYTYYMIERLRDFTDSLQAYEFSSCI